MFISTDTVWMVVKVPHDLCLIFHNIKAAAFRNSCSPNVMRTWQPVEHMITDDHKVAVVVRCRKVNECSLTCLMVAAWCIRGKLKGRGWYRRERGVRSLLLCGLNGSGKPHRKRAGIPQFSFIGTLPVPDYCKGTCRSCPAATALDKVMVEG